jgi:hypothetical protein
MHSKTLLFSGLVVLATNAGNAFARYLPDLLVQPGESPAVPVGTPVRTPAPSISKLSQAFPVATPGPEEQRCLEGDSDDFNVAHLCQFTCKWGFCPEPTCFCFTCGPVKSPPPIVKTGDFTASSSDWREYMDYNRLCEFACRHGFCPKDTCEERDVDADWEDQAVVRWQSPYVDEWQWFDWGLDTQECLVFKTGVYRDHSRAHCANYCREIVQEAVAKGGKANVGCVGYFALNKPIPWTQYPASIGEDMVYAPGMCMCDNMVTNSTADAVIDALPSIHLLGCPIVLSALKFLVEGPFIHQVGPDGAWILDPALDAAATAAQLLAYVYPEGEDPEGAFEFWLTTCGGSDYIPDNITRWDIVKKAYIMLSSIPAGSSSFKPPKNIKRGSGKKGDAANPLNRPNPNPKAITSSGRYCKEISQVLQEDPLVLEPAHYWD